MDQCTHEVRAEYWRRVIQACGQRPAGQSAKSWMDANGICEQSYYHWQRKFRQAAYDQMKDDNNTVPAVAEKTDLSFVELPYRSTPETNEPVVLDHPVAVINTSALKIEITNDISASLLSQILREVSHA